MKLLEKIVDKEPIRLEINVKMYKNSEFGHYQKKYDFKTEDDFRKFFMRVESLLKELDKIEDAEVMADVKSELAWLRTVYR